MVHLCLSMYMYSHTRLHEKLQVYNQKLSDYLWVVEFLVILLHVF